MANKYELISKLAEETAKEVVKNGETWKQYLDAAARIYKYPFQEQLLIYAQRPDATACASIDIWNSRRFNCWVNKGAKGIALIDEDAPRPRLKYVFDISDIHKARRIGRTPYLWKMEPDHQETVIDHLEHIYGGTQQDKSFEERLLEIAQRITLDCYEEVWEDLQYLTEGSYLEGLDEYSGKIHLREIMQSSISYTLLARCGMDMENYEELLNFDYIHEFNTVPALSQLGSNITELCKPLLMEIGKAIRAYDREISKKRVANRNNLDYNALKCESKKQNTVEDANENTENSRNEERSQDYGTDISEERRLLHPEYQNGRAASGSADQIRDDAEDISAGTQEGALLRTSADRQADEPFVGDSGSGRAEDGGNHGADGSGQRDSRPRIFAKYQKWLGSAKMAEFLKREYGRGGKGFTFEGESLSVWYDEDGMKFARADAARFQPMRTLSWMEVEERTYNLILDGKYMDEAEMWHVPTLEKMELASKVYNFFQDEYGSVPKELEIPHIHPAAEEKLAEYFSSQEGIDQVLGHMDQAIGALQRGDVKARFHLLYRPEDIRESVEELKRRPMKFPPAENLEVPVETFITQDEIDYRLSMGSGFEHGLFRIYEFFQSNHDKKEQADFLKNEYGTGGSTSALPGAWHSYENHDAKGLRLSKGTFDMAESGRAYPNLDRNKPFSDT